MSNEHRNRVGVIETRGIEPVPDGERQGGPMGLFWMWFGANISVLGITIGAAIITFNGLNVVQAFIATVVGSGASFLLVGLISNAGKRGGAPGLTLSRAVFGIRGNWGPTLMSWSLFVGWEIILCTTAAYALLALLALAGVVANTPLTVACVLVVVLIAAFIGLFGHATIMWIQKWITWVFGGLTAVIVAFLIATVDWERIFSAPAQPISAVIGGIGFIAAGTGLAFLSAGADYARYLPRKVRSGRVVGATILGGTIPVAIMITIGALMAVGDDTLAAANDPVAAIGASLPTWLLAPYLLTAIAGMIAGADLSMYSSGLNLITAGIKIRRSTAVSVDAVLIVVGAIYITVVASDFYGAFYTFVTLLAVPVTAWAGIFLIDMIGRKYYDAFGLLDTKPGSRYWYVGGISWSAMGSWITGIVLGLLFTRAAGGTSVMFEGPWSNTWIGENALGWLVAGIASAILYPVLRVVFRQQTTFAAPGTDGGSHPLTGTHHNEELVPKVGAAEVLSD